MNSTLYIVFMVALLGAGEAVAEPIVVADSRGVVMRLERAAQRVLSLAPSQTEWVFALGAQARLVGRTDACDAPAAAAKVPSVGSLFPPDYERIVATRPDVVLMMGGTEVVRARLEKLGLRVFVWQPETVAQGLEGGRRLARLLGVDAKAVEQVGTAIEQVSASPLKRRVAYLAWPSPVTLAGSETFAADLVRRAGGAFVTVGGEDWPRITLEQLAVLDPDLLVGGKGLALGGAWQHLPVVKRGVCWVDPALLGRPGPRMHVAIAAIRRCL